MAQVIDCPSCHRTLRVPDDLQGSQVKCPSCGVTFAAEHEKSEADQGRAEEPGPATQPREATQRCPYCAESIPAQATSCPHCRELVQIDKDAGEERPWERPGMPIRRDCEPHRAGLILALGIISIVVGALGPCLSGLTTLIALPLGITTWVLASRDLRKMRTREMDPAGMSQTNSGRICAIVGTSLGCLCFTGYGLMFSYMLFAH